MDTMLTLQEMDPTPERDRSARRHGQSLLAGLAALQRSLLAGTEAGTPAALAHLAGLLADMPEAADPGLAGVVAAIRTRVAVELARHGG